MIYTELTIKAMNIAYKAHEGQLDKSGCPYILHPAYLAERVPMIGYGDWSSLKEYPTETIGEYLSCIAWLHDVVEDSDITIDDLSKEFPKEVIEAVDLLTHKDGVDYFDYINTINENAFARKVKIEDLLHNLKNDRQSFINEDQAKKDARKKKYIKAFSILSDDDIIVD